MFRDRFTPRRLRRYLDGIDQEIAQAARSGFYAWDELDYHTEPDRVLVTGVIACAGGIRIEVDERLRMLHEPSWLRRIGNPLIQLEFYRYNAVLLNRGTIFRYNSPHVDHRMFHHVHQFDLLGSGTETVDEVRARDVPSLRQLVQEAEAWHWANLNRDADAA